MCDRRKCHIVTDRINTLLSCARQACLSGPNLKYWQLQSLNPQVLHPHFPGFPGPCLLTLSPVQSPEWSGWRSQEWGSLQTPSGAHRSSRLCWGILPLFLCCGYRVRLKASALSSPTLVWDTILFLLGLTQELGPRAFLEGPNSAKVLG